MPNSVLTESLRSALGALPERRGKALQSALSDQHAVDIAEALHDLKPAEALTVFSILEGKQAGAVLAELDGDRIRYLLDNSTPADIGATLAAIPANDAAWVVSHAAPGRIELVLSGVTIASAKAAEAVQELLQYPAGSAGRLMTRKFVQLTEDLTVEQAFAAIRQVDPEVETLTDIYVVDDEVPDKLVGILSLRDLTRTQPEQKLSEIMTRNVISVTVDSKQEEVAKLISKYDFLALPVLDRRGALAGIVMVDDLIDVLVSKSWEDQLRFGAVEPGVLDQPYFSTSIWRVVRSRVGWLVLLFVAETLTGSVLRHFEDELTRVVALSFFIPLLIGTGGNTGSQTVSTIIRGLALHEIYTRDLLRVLSRELLSGLLLGALLGVFAFGRSQLWGSTLSLSSVVALTILAICTWANTIGSLIPLVAQRLKIDPALVSAPLITTLVDATGLAIYLSIAKVLLPQLR